MRFFIFLLLPLFTACSLIPSNAQLWPLSENVNVGERFMQIRLLGTFKLSRQKVNGLSIQGLSGLAWDEDESILYAVSDRGMLYHLKIHINNEQLQSAEIVHAVRLQDQTAKALTRKNWDAEGLSLKYAKNGKRGDTELWVSLEGTPRVWCYNNKGELLDEVTLPPFLNRVDVYQHNNKGLESLSLHPQYGLVTAPEIRLKKSKSDQHSLYSIDGQHQWHFAVPDVSKSSVTGLEVLANGNFLVLERALSTAFHLSIRLREVDTHHCNAEQLCTVKDLAVFDNNEGWSIDNFEGLTHYRDNLYFIVSDDNGRPFLQNSLLSLFEILPEL